MPSLTSVLVKQFDLYKRIDQDFVRSTCSSTSFSIFSIVITTVLLYLEITGFMAATPSTEIVLDDSLGHSDTLTIGFNVTVLDLPCVLLSVDVVDVTGTDRRNVTKNINMLRVDHNNHVLGAVADEAILAEEHKDVVSEEEQEQKDFMTALETGEFQGRGEVHELDQDTFSDFIKEHGAPHEVILVDFYAPWCIWCQRLHPTITQLGEKLGAGGPLWVARVDCTDDKNEKLCISQHVRAFPTLRFYRHASEHPFESYHGKRTSEQMLFRLRMLARGDQDEADTKKNIKHRERGHGLKAPIGAEGCRLEGYLNVKKVPGSVRINLYSPRYSVIPETVNASHWVQYFKYFDPENNMGELMGFDYARDLVIQQFSKNPLQELQFTAHTTSQTYVHYMKLVAKEFQSKQAGIRPAHVYTFSAYSNEHLEPEGVIPMINFEYDISPLSVLQTFESQPLYRFVTRVMAIFGGVFAVMQVLENLVFELGNSFSKKTD